MYFDIAIKFEKKNEQEGWDHFFQTEANIKTLNKNDFYALGGIKNKNLVKFEIERNDITVFLNNTDYRIVTLLNDFVWNIEVIDTQRAKRKGMVNIYGYKKI